MTESPIQRRVRQQRLDHRRRDLHRHALVRERRPHGLERHAPRPLRADLEPPLLSDTGPGTGARALRQPLQQARGVQHDEPQRLGIRIAAREHGAGPARPRHRQAASLTAPAAANAVTTALACASATATSSGGGEAVRAQRCTRRDNTRSKPAWVTP